MTETKKGKWIKGKFNFIKRIYEPCDDNAVDARYICSECNSKAYSDYEWGERLSRIAHFAERKWKIKNIGEVAE